MFVRAPVRELRGIGLFEFAVQIRLARHQHAREVLGERRPRAQNVLQRCLVEAITFDSRRGDYGGAARLAGALRRLGVRPGDRVATFGWNTQRHLEAYLAVPSMGAVLHTLNIRLFPEQLAFIINHADDKVIICDGSLIPLLAKVRDQLSNVQHIIVSGPGDRSLLGNTLDYEELLANEKPGITWPVFDERKAAAMCYTSGTTGNPKGVMQTHAATLRAFWSWGDVVGLREGDRYLVVNPFFHAFGYKAGWLAALMKDADGLDWGRFGRPDSGYGCDIAYLRTQAAADMAVASIVTNSTLRNTVLPL